MCVVGLFFSNQTSDYNFQASGIKQFTFFSSIVKIFVPIPSVQSMISHCCVSFILCLAGPAPANETSNGDKVPKSHRMGKSSQVDSGSEIGTVLTESSG